jgi:hypothetical protein
LVDLTFIIPNFEKEDESVPKVPLEIQAIGGTKILGARFRLTLIDLDKEINDIKEMSWYEYPIGNLTTTKNSTNTHVVFAILELGATLS